MQLLKLRKGSAGLIVKTSSLESLRSCVSLYRNGPKLKSLAANANELLYVHMKFLTMYDDT